MKKNLLGKSRWLFVSLGLHQDHCIKSPEYVPRFPGRAQFTAEESYIEASSDTPIYATVTPPEAV